jgi:hypothetical protein
MVSGRVYRGGLFLVLTIDGGQAWIGLAAGSSRDSEPALIPCSLVGLFNVLSGVEYNAVGSDRQCRVRAMESHVELIWKREKSDTVFRLTKNEYRNLLRSVGDESQRAA